jgi:hypothetical protein
MESFAKLIGKLPFAGKIAIRLIIFSFYQSMTAQKRRWNYLWLMLLLVFFVLFHGVQAQMGIEALSFDAPYVVKVVSALYAVANVCVVLTQMYLGFRATHFLFCAPYPRMQRRDRGYSAANTAIMFAITLGGQTIFCFLYNLYS